MRFFLFSDIQRGSYEKFSQDCSGAFAIVPIPEEEAVRKLSDLGIVK